MLGWCEWVSACKLLGVQLFLFIFLVYFFVCISASKLQLLTWPTWYIIHNTCQYIQHYYWHETYELLRTTEKASGSQWEPVGNTINYGFHTSSERWASASRHDAGGWLGWLGHGYGYVCMDGYVVWATSETTLTRWEIGHLILKIYHPIPSLMPHASCLIEYCDW